MLYFDEAGNSGDNLLDLNQPSYTLVSHNFTEQEANFILAHLLSITSADELHFKKIRKSGAQKKALIKCFNNELIEDNRIRFFVVHKEFHIAINIVDRLIETVFHHAGADISKNEYNILTANLLHATGTQVWDYVLYRTMCSCFVNWVRSRSGTDAKYFYDAVLALYKATQDRDHHELLSYILESHKYYQEIVSGFEKFMLDPTLPCFVSHCHSWSTKGKGPLDITFDNTHSINYWRGMIDFLTNDVPDTEAGHGSRKHNLRLNINSFITGDSKAHRSLQLADMFASSLNSLFIVKHDDSYQAFKEAILDSRLATAQFDSLKPLSSIKNLNIGEPVGRNALDTYVEVFEKNPDVFKKIDRSKW